MAVTTKKSKWDLFALADLEYFAAKSTEASDIRSRDRAFYLKAFAGEKEVSRPRLLLLWVEHQRDLFKKNHPHLLLPGTIFREIHTLVRRFLLIVGIAAGSGAAASVLIYSGRFPVNVAVFFSVTVMLPYLFFLVAALTRFFTSSGTWAGHGLLAALVRWSLRKFHYFSQKGLSEKHRMRIQAAVGAFFKGKGIYGSTGFWTLFSLTQRFSIGYGIGAFSVSVLRVFFSDLAFGWQSTLRLSAAAVHRIVTWLAIPWASFLPPDLAHPTLEQIEGSRMVLKEGLSHLQSGDLAAWWPFLVLCILVYGVIPRILLLAMSSFFINRSVSNLDFNQSSLQPIFDRMAGPVVTTTVKTRREPVEQMRSPEPDDNPPLPSFGAVLAVVPEEILSDELAAALEEGRGCPPGSKLGGLVRIADDFGDERTALEELRQTTCNEILLIMEAWRPPIDETLDFISAACDAVGEKIRVRVGLLGKPMGPGIYDSVNPRDLQVWKSRVASLGDSRIFVWPMDIGNMGESLVESKSS